MKKANPDSLVTIIGVQESASFFHSSVQQQSKKLKCVYLFCTTYIWKSL